MAKSCYKITIDRLTRLRRYLRIRSPSPEFKKRAVSLAPKSTKSQHRSTPFLLDRATSTTATSLPPRSRHRPSITIIATITWALRIHSNSSRISSLVTSRLLRKLPLILSIQKSSNSTSLHLNKKILIRRAFHQKLLQETLLKARSQAVIATCTQ